MEFEPNRRMLDGALTMGTAPGLLIILILYSFVGAAIMEAVERESNFLTYWNWLEFCLTTSSTLGYGHVIPVTPAGKALTVLYALTSIPLFFLTLLKSAQILLMAATCLNTCILRACRRESKQASEPIEITGMDPEQSTPDPKLPTEVGSVDPGKTVTSCVPDSTTPTAALNPCIPLVALMVYIFAGGAMFTEMDDDYWGYWNGIYFIFISLTTIGYGDFVPRGNDIFFGSFVYVFFGMMLLVFCILAFVEFFKRRQQKARK